MRAVGFMAISAFVVLAAPAAHATSPGGPGGLCFTANPPAHCATGKPKSAPQAESGGWGGYPSRRVKAGGYGNPDGNPNHPLKAGGFGKPNGYGNGGYGPRGYPGFGRAY